MYKYKSFLLSVWLAVVLPALSAISLSAQDIPQNPPTEIPVTKPEVDSILAVHPSSTVLDTLDTEDKFTKIVLYDDFTWKYYDVGKPVIDEETFYDNWDTDEIHAYKELSLTDMPDEVDLMLVDSTHSYCIPFQAKVRSKYAFRRSRPHKGIDLPLHTGDTIRAAFDGVVRICAVSRETGGYGNLLVLRHPNGLETYYGHLSKHLVEAGEVVKAGEIIGYGGSTGRSTGPHLHFETRFQGKPFDPERVFDFENGILRDSILCIKKHYYSIYSHYGQTDQESVKASQRQIHVIKSGDTLGRLAAKYGTTISNICKLNGISAKTTLRIGRRLIVR